MAILGKCLRTVDRFNEWTGSWVSYLIPILALVVGYEVIARNVFNRPTVWAHELSAMIFGAFVLLGGATTGSKGMHVNMDVLYNTLRPRTRALLDVVTFAFSLAFVWVLLWKGGYTAWRSVRVWEHASTQWGPPLYPFKLLLPLGAFLLLVQLVAKFLRDLAVAVTGEVPASWR